MKHHKINFLPDKKLNSSDSTNDNRKETENHKENILSEIKVNALSGLINDHNIFGNLEIVVWNKDKSKKLLKFESHICTEANDSKPGEMQKPSKQTPITISKVGICIVKNSLNQVDYSLDMKTMDSSRISQKSTKLGNAFSWNANRASVNFTLFTAQTKGNNKLDNNDSTNIQDQSNPKQLYLEIPPKHKKKKIFRFQKKFNFPSPLQNLTSINNDCSTEITNLRGKSVLSKRPSHFCLKNNFPLKIETFRNL